MAKTIEEGKGFFDLYFHITAHYGRSRGQSLEVGREPEAGRGGTLFIVVLGEHIPVHFLSMASIPPGWSGLSERQ